MRTIVAFVLALALGADMPAAAQWYVGVEIAAHHYGGSSHDTSSSPVASQGRPGDATGLSLRVGHNGRKFGLALRGTYSKPGLAVTGPGINLTDKTSGDLVELVWLL